MLCFLTLTLAISSVLTLYDSPNDLRLPTHHSQHVQFSVVGEKEENIAIAQMQHTLGSHPSQTDPKPSITRLEILSDGNPCGKHRLRGDMAA
jgi:hypothetical protein